MSADSRLRLFCLWLIVFQNSSLILVTSYSRTLVPAYLPSVAVFLSELMKLAAVISLLAYETPGGASEAIRQCVSLVRDTPHETAQFAVPALCYTLQNNLWYHALSNLDPVTAAVTSQLKVFTTAIASVVMLGRRVNTKQWGALTLLMGGMILMQLKDGADSGGDEEGEGGGADVVSSVPPRSVPQNTWHGALAMLGSTMLSAYARGVKSAATERRGAAVRPQCRSLAPAPAPGAWAWGWGWGWAWRLEGQRAPARGSPCGGWVAGELRCVSPRRYAGVFLERLFKTVQQTLWLQVRSRTSPARTLGVGLVQRTLWVVGFVTVAAR